MAIVVVYVIMALEVGMVVGLAVGTVPREAAEEVPEMDVALVVDEAVVMRGVITITGKVNLVAIPLTGVATRIESGVMIRK